MGVTFQRCPGSLPGIKTSLHEQPILAFADYTKDFLLKTDVSKRDWEQCCPRIKQTGVIIW